MPTAAPKKPWCRRRSGATPINCTKLFIRNKRLTTVEVDRRHIIADADATNNVWPRRIVSSRLELYKAKDNTRNLMLDQLAELSAKDAPKAADKPVPLKPVE
jgi:hypothetical protein